MPAKVATGGLGLPIIAWKGSLNAVSEDLLSSSSSLGLVESKASGKNCSSHTWSCCWGRGVCVCVCVSTTGCLLLCLSAGLGF